ncbi:MAG: hypothetical protein DWQ47_17510 [Acidobacteria bacterium]|nr:MAG: hypothetical protein DWQ32_04910 [Acidobacteriota bacterium]REK02163.1 MAG: hypothetical protein DWQ38_07245 [Acidobacteriota bacterium]REK14035.1 MAG: hypothetical protein DWQ43_10600 [Acidobacteriota bacterium]REK42030.1 MAG: hypothetical protein DWQ47_17510 [Acidobacteriota bacterium]
MSNEINDLVGFEQFHVDTRKAVLWFDGELVDVPMKSVELLSVLIKRPGEVISKESLMNAVWGDAFVEESVLTQNIYRLRKIFRESGIETELIQTVPRRGYMIVGTIETDEIAEISVEHERIERTFVVDDEQELLTSIPLRKGINRPVAFSLGVIALPVAVLFGVAVWNRMAEDRPAALPIIENVRFERITESGRAIEPAISRDNRNLAYVRSGNNEHTIVLRNIATGSETVVVGPKEHELASLSFSPESDHLYYIAREKESPDSTVYKIPLFGGNERKILTGIRHFVSVSPKSGRLAYIRHESETNTYHLMESGPDGSGERRIATRKPPEFFQDWNTYPAWSPDESKIVMPAHSQPGEGRETSENYLIAVETESGKETRIKHPEWAGVGNVFWASDGKSLFVSAREKADSFMQIWRLKYPTGEANRVTNDTNDYRDFKLSANSELIVAANVSSSSDLFVVDTADPSSSQRLTKQNLANFGRWGLDWFPDGKYLVVVKNKGRNDGELFKIDVTNGKESQLTYFEGASVLGPRVAPDGTVFFASNRTGKWHIWSIAGDGTGLKQITFGASGENHPDVSSDGTYLYFGRPGRAPTELWRKQLPDGEDERLNFRTAGPTRMSPTNPSQLVSFLYVQDAKYPWTVVLADLDQRSGPENLYFEPENHVFAWDRSGSGIYFGKKSLSVSNLWFKPIDKQPARQVTDYDTGKVVGVAVSSDGSRIALSRENTVSNLFMIKGFLGN